MTTELMKLGSRDILGKTVTAFGTVENPLFLAKEVAEWIEHSNVSAMLAPIDDDEKVKLKGCINNAYTPPDLESEGGENEHTERWFLTENGLYEVLFLSRKPVAKEFKKGVKQLLHDLRTGKAQVKLTGNELVLAAITHLQSELGKEQQLRLTAEAKVTADAPKVAFAEKVGDCAEGFGIRELALKFRQSGADFGEKELVKKLLGDGYCYRDQKGYLRPYAEYVQDGLFWLATAIREDDMGIRKFEQMKFTGKGGQYFLDLYLSPPVEAGGEFPKGYFLADDEAA